MNEQLMVGLLVGLISGAGAVLAFWSSDRIAISKSSIESQKIHESTLDQWRKNRDGYFQEIRELKADIATRSRMEESLKSDIASLNETIESQKELVRAKDVEVNCMTENALSFQSERDKAISDCKGAIRELNRVHGEELNAKSAKIIKLEMDAERFDELKIEKDALAYRVEKLTEEIGELERTAMEFTDANARLRKDLENSFPNRQSIMRELELSADHCNELIAENLKLRKSSEELRMEVDGLKVALVKATRPPAKKAVVKKAKMKWTDPKTACVAKSKKS